MTDEMKKLGFKCGMEIHQQLLTEKKLFCRCPAGLYSTDHHAEVLRHMRPTLSEMGVYDGCALMEFKTKKDILYLLNKKTVCTYEMDDTPPFPINQQALDVAIEIALLTGCSIVDEMHIARKQYLDGSIPTGFQRTGIVGINGSIPFGNKKIEVTQLSIEEDSCRERSDDKHLIKFRTDRLGMPLIEVVTDACFKTPEEAGEGVRHIGRLLRATGHVRRGLGAVRQDVNVSIEGGSRVEIKGVPRYQLIPALTRNEALRQKALLDIRKELKKRKLTKDNLKFFDCDLTDELKNSASPPLRDAIRNGHRIRGIKFEKLSGILRHPTQPGKTFASELAGRVRVIACLDEIPNIYHTDSYPEYPRNHIDLKTLRLSLKLNCDDSDVGIVVWGPDADTVTAINEIRNRIFEAFDGVPCETRQSLRNGLSDFERILPGADRMYPDTDHPPVRIANDRVLKIKDALPEPTYEVEKRLEEHGVPKDTLKSLAISDYIALIDKLHKEGRDMKLVGRILGQTVRSLKRQGVESDKVTGDRWAELITACDEKKIPSKHIEGLVTNLVAYPERSVEDIVLSVCEKIPAPS
ncbi:MAG: Glu-tRNA(Gln) amidotransferase subunit GatE [Deltaproteobacteria bacterium]|jgi:glutamyl-tRNA(Gln) amidotransferase subunit E|nr:Glu-tRNA(Gln) amidotransferase subunit GatE [Deltaproteobacteria bacterium]